MKATRFMRQPFIVTACKVTEEDMKDIARWCGGHIVEPTKGDQRSFIRVPVNRYTNVKQTEGHVGMWVVLSLHRGEESFKVYTDEWLEKTFIPIPREPEPDDEDYERALAAIPGEVTRDLIGARQSVIHPRDGNHPIQKAVVDPLAPFQSA